MTDKPEKEVLCPSAPAEPGATLIGVVGSDGRVAHLATGLKIDAEFIKEAIAHGPLEQRYRFSLPCQEKRCANWNGKGCGVIEELHTFASSTGVLQETKLSPCSIRESCRWWIQRGREACAACPLAVTDQKEISSDGDAMVF
jgi:hypothetical protein